MENSVYKSYVRVDDRGCITRGFTNAFEQPQDGDVLHNERGGRHFQLVFADGSLSEPNSPLADEWGVLLYRLVDGFAEARSPEELEADRQPPEAGPDTLGFVLGLMGAEEGGGEERAGGLALRVAALAGFDVGSLLFVSLAQDLEIFDDVTIMEHAYMFAEWPEETGLVCKRGTIVWDAGTLYRALHDIGEAHRMTRPSEDPTLWGEIGDPTEEWPLWSQWIGVGDTYQAGDKVRSVDYGNAGDSTIYRWVSTADNNVWRPGEYGWEKAGVHG